MQLHVPWFKPAAWGVVVGAVGTMIWSCPGFVKGELLSRRLTAPPPRGIGR